MKKNNYIFIGMSGVGKSTIAQEIAQIINFQFIDSDRLIEEEFKKPLQDVVDSFELKSDFLKKEKEVIANLNFNQATFAPGGSVCYHSEALEKHKGKVIYLKISWNEITKRLNLDFSKRGFIQIEDTIEKEFEKRLKLYEMMADFTINCENKTQEIIIKEVLNIINI